MKVCPICDEPVGANTGMYFTGYIKRKYYEKVVVHSSHLRKGRGKFWRGSFK